MDKALSELETNITDITKRGFTGHEMLDEVGLIHMNGRIYDPRLGRFLQADPLIDGVTDTQGYNRYSYVHNNPLNATDPSGFSAWTRFRDNFLKPVIQAVVTAYCIPCGTALAAATTAYYGGDAFDVAIAAFSTYVMASMGQDFAKGGFSGGEAFVFGVTGGITSALRGGKFGHGFVSAYTGAVTGGFVRGLDNAAAELIASSVIAGSISEATGGKFANGAAYGAFSWAVAQGANSLKEGGLSDGENRDGQNYSAEAAKALDDLNDRIADLKNFNSKDEALKWLHENAHPLAVNYDIEIGANIFEDFGNWRIGNTVSDFEAHYIYGRTIMQSKAPAKGWNWRANWHSHAKGVSTDFSGQDSNLYLNLNRGRSPKLTFHVSVFNGEKNVLLDY